MCELCCPGYRRLMEKDSRNIPLTRRNYIMTQDPSAWEGDAQSCIIHSSRVWDLTLFWDKVVQAVLKLSSLLFHECWDYRCASLFHKYKKEAGGRFMLTVPTLEAQARGRLSQRQSWLHMEGNTCSADMLTIPALRRLRAALAPWGRGGGLTHY